MLENELQQLGLNDSESKIYLIALDLGVATIQELTDQSGIKRSTVYNIIESLINKNLLKRGGGNNKKLLHPLTPKNLGRIFDSQELDILRKKETLGKILPELLFLFSSIDTRLRVKYFEGKQGAIALKKEYLKTKSKKIDNILYYDNSSKITKDIKKYTKERVNKGIMSRYAYVSKKGRDLNLEKTDEIELRESLYIPYNNFPFDINVSIFDEKVVLQFDGDNKYLAIMMNNSCIARSFQSFFEFVWNKFKK